MRAAPLALFPRDDLEEFAALADPPASREGLGSSARAIAALLDARGACFSRDIARETRLLSAQLEDGLAELAARGVASCDAFAGLRQLLVPPSKRRRTVASMGRWSLFLRGGDREPDPEFIARQLLHRSGVVFRRTLARERQPVPWRDLIRVLRRFELRGDVRGGRFVAGFDGEQYALPEAVKILRRTRREGARDSLEATAADPLNLRGILTPEARVPSRSGRVVTLAAGTD